MGDAGKNEGIRESLPDFRSAFPCNAFSLNPSQERLGTSLITEVV